MTLASSLKTIHLVLDLGVRSCVVICGDSCNFAEEQGKDDLTQPIGPHQGGKEERTTLQASNSESVDVLAGNNYRSTE